MKNLLFLAIVLMLSPVALLGFACGALVGGFRAGMRGAESFLGWVCS
jgi:hypothetical protein